MAKKNTTKFRARVDSFGFLGRYWTKGDVVEVSPEELDRQRKLANTKVTKVVDGEKTTQTVDRSELKHFEQVDIDTAGRITPSMAASGTIETQNRLMNLPDDSHPAETLPEATAADATEIPDGAAPGTTTDVNPPDSAGVPKKRGRPAKEEEK